MAKGYTNSTHRVNIYTQLFRVYIKSILTLLCSSVNGVLHLSQAGLCNTYTNTGTECCHTHTHMYTHNTMLVLLMDTNMKQKHRHSHLFICTITDTQQHVSNDD